MLCSQADRHREQEHQQSMLDLQKRGLEEEQRRLNDQSQKLEQFNMQVSQVFQCLTFESWTIHDLACNQVQEQSRVAQERQKEASAEMSKVSCARMYCLRAQVLFVSISVTSPCIYVRY